MSESSTPQVVVRCFSHVGITVADLDASIAFYTEVFGFRRLFDDVEEQWRRVGLAMGELGDIQLELFSPHPVDTPDDPVDPFYPRDFGRPKLALTVVDIEATYDRLVAAGITPLTPITTTRVSRIFFVADPDGTPIQLHEFTGGQQRVTELFA